MPEKKTQTYFHPLQSLKFRTGRARIFSADEKQRKLLIDEYIRVGAVVPDWLLEEPDPPPDAEYILR